LGDWIFNPRSHPAIAHAEAVATVLDKIMSLAFSMQVRATTAMELLSAAGFTSAQLDLWFRKPVLSPASCQPSCQGMVSGQLLQEQQEGVGCGHLNWGEEKLLRAEASGLLPQAGGNFMKNKRKRKRKKRVNLPVLVLFLSFPSQE
jgi:hypothetical protein